MTLPPPQGHVALLLHAHLPYVRHPEHPRSFEERWLYEALWESYLPLLDVLDRVAADGIAPSLTISISPPLAAMLGDALLQARFEYHLDRTEALAARVDALFAGSEFAPAAAFYRRKLAAARAGWEARRGDVLGALVRHSGAGHIELLSTSASHAYLPGLLPSPGSLRAQIRLGRRALEAFFRAPAPRGFWLPECGYDPRLDGDLAAAGVRYTVVDAHALEIAAPRVPAPLSPILSPAGVAFFARDPASAREVWSRDEGYPGHPAYREFYRDAGFDLPEDALAGEIGAGGGRLMTGLKLHRITGPALDKRPYEPGRAAAQARAHAADFITRRTAQLSRLDLGAAPPILVAAYDAELFGHWWLEGPDFLEHVIRGLAASARAGGPTPITLGAYLERYGTYASAQPAASSWGEGGWGAVWIGPRTAHLWRHVHHADRRVRAAVEQGRGQGDARGRALDQAIRELLLLEASDWAFMLDRGEMQPYAEARARAHGDRARRLADLARRGSHSPEELAWIDAACAQDRFLAELSGAALQDAFDAWSPAPQDRLDGS